MTRRSACLVACLIAALFPIAAPAEIAWKEVGGVKVPVPPAEHPRVCLRAKQAEELKGRLEEPALAPIVEKLKGAAKRSPQSRVEWDAIQALAHGDRALGRSTVERCLELLRKCELADKQDACRETGRMMVTGAIVYDWLYPSLSADEKQAFIRELIRLAKTLECGYPPTRQGSVTGHSSEAMVMRDMLSAGIAIYDEYPEMYDLAAGRFFREHLPARNWLYSGHAYHQGDSYGPHRYSWDTYPLLIFDRLGAGNVYNPEQRWVSYYYLYGTRPDGQRLRGGDTFAHSARRGQPWGQYIGTLLSASYYGDGVLLSQSDRQGGIGGNELIFDFLWRDAALAPQPLDGLPLSRYFGSPFGWMIARTGWDENAVIAEMKINEYNFANHQHLDAGAFQIYYRGALAIDSGLYSGSSGAYGSPHCTNYYWRTIAHNALLVYDPQEQFSNRKDYGNDGGQRLPNGRSEPRTLDSLLNGGYRTGRVLAQGFGPDVRTPRFTLLQGDITEAYSKKVRQVTRSFAFFNLQELQVPAAMVVFDRVVSSNPSLEKSWLLHSQEEPRIDGTTAVVDCTQHGQRGRLTLDALLPRADNLQLRSVGGPGKEFWVFGQNYANDVEPQRLANSSMEPGAWRIEVSPKKQAGEDLFLNAMQVTDREKPGRLAVQRVETPDRVGCTIAGKQANWLVLFRRDAAPSDQAVAIETPEGAACRMLVTDLKPGLWRAQRRGDRAAQEVRVTEELKAAWIEGPGGHWSVERQP